MTLADWLIDFKAYFPEFSEITDSEGTDVTNTALTYYLDLGTNMLPQGAIEYFTTDRLVTVVNYMVAHLLAYYDVLNAYDTTKSLIRTTSSMSADGLSLSFNEVAKLNGDTFSTLNDFLNTTSYGRTVAVYLDQMAGSVGGFCV